MVTFKCFCVCHENKLAFGAVLRRSLRLAALTRSRFVICHLPVAISLALVALISGNLGATASPSQELATAPTNVGHRTFVSVNFTTVLPEGVNQRMVEEGRNIFHDRGGCVRCHGKDGSGTFFGPSLANRQHIHLQTGSYQEILDLIRSGVPRPKRYLGAMPPLGGTQLSNDEVRAVGAFVYILIHGS